MRLEDSFQAFFFLSFVPCDGIRSRAERANMFFSFRKLPLQWLTVVTSTRNQGCRMVYFQTENPNLDKFGRALDRRMLIYFMGIHNIL
jgi:hypothetical protein